MWKIQKTIRKGDYFYALVPDHPNSTKNGYVLYHRIVMENHLGRLLDSKEIVHHVNGDKFDNSVENLQVLTANQHASLHGAEMLSTLVRLKCPCCQEIFIRRIGNTNLIPCNQSKRATFCSRSCSGKFNKAESLFGLTQEMKQAISENILEVFQGKLRANNE